MNRKDLRVIFLITLVAGIATTCEVNNSELGADLLPPGDEVLLFHDTIFDIQATSVTGDPINTSESKFTNNPNRLYLLGSLHDTISGFSEATIVSEFNTSSSFKNGPNTEIDSLVFYLQVQDYLGEMEEPVTIRIYELKERIYIDSVYYSDFDISGKYSELPLAEIRVVPQNSTILQFHIEDEDFLNRFIEIQEDTSYFRNDSIFKDYFNGLYITADPGPGRGAMARVGLANSLTKLSMKYANDSTEVDTTAGRDYRWVNFPIDFYSTQKINLFDHDFSGTYLSTVIDRDGADVPYLYVQGMSGVNTRLSFSTLQDWIDSGQIAINQATLIFDVVPDAKSGILHQDLPERLMLLTELGGGKYEPLYDLVVDDVEDSRLFGGKLKAESAGMFFDTTYTYRFNIGLHFQAMIREEILKNRFILQVNDAETNPRFTKLWSNHPANPKRLRLEIVYTKL